MPFPREMPPPLLLPNAPTHPTHTRNASRASPTRARITDDLLSDLSPATTLAAFTSSSSPSSRKLRASIEAASPGEREFGIRAATAASKIKEWFSELQSWPWPDSGSSGFEVPAVKRRKISIADSSNQYLETDDSLHRDRRPVEDVLQEDSYCGSLDAKDVAKYSVRIDEILDDMEDLNVEGIKSHILDLHVPGRSRPTSSTGALPSPSPSLFSYPKMDDFTAVVTATVLQALPYLARLQMLMDVWTIRLVVLRQIKPLLDALEDAEAAVRSGWHALDISGTAQVGETEGNGDNLTLKQQYLSRDAFKTMQQVLQSKVTLVGQKLDRMLDTLEGRQDTLPDTWLDRMELLENQYADWTALANRKVLEGEWAKQNSLHRESAGKDQSETSKPPSRAGTDERVQASKTLVPNDSVVGSKVQDSDFSKDRKDSGERSSFSTDVLIVPEKHLTVISQFDGGKEIERGTESPETPQTASTAVPKSFRNHIGGKIPSTPPSLICSPSATTSPRHPITDERSNTENLSVETMADFGPGPENQAELKTEMDGQSKTHGTQGSGTPPTLETGVRHEAKQSPATPRKHTDLRLGTAALDESTNSPPATPRSHVLGRDDTTDRSFRELSETPRISSSTQSVISTGSSYAPSDCSPTANRVPPAKYPRRVLSPTQSSADWFDFGDEKTPTKASNGPNLFSPKQDVQKTPTPDNNLATHHKNVPYREGLNDEEYENKENSGRGGGIEKSGTGAASEALTPDPKDHPIISFGKATPHVVLPPLPPISKRKSLELLASPEFSVKATESPLEPPMLPNVGVLEAPDLFSPTKGSANQLQQQISEILESLPARIRLTTERERNPFPDLKIPKKRPALKKTVSTSSLHVPSRSPTPTPSFTLTAAYSKNSPRPRHSNAHPEIKLYHLSRSNGGAPIKLFVRLVGENGERVMVRVGGGWADLGEYLREYAIHHSRRNAPEDKIQIHDSSARIVSTSSISSARNGQSSPVSRSVSAMDGPISRPATSMGNRRPSAQHERPVTSLAIRKTRDRKSVGEEARQAQYRSPSTPMPIANRARRAVSVSHSETPPSATSTTSRSSSRLSYSGEDANLGLSGPRSKYKELSEENEKWVESMTEKVKKASAEKEKKHLAILGDMGKAGSTKRLFRKS